MKKYLWLLVAGVVMFAAPGVSRADESEILKRIETNQERILQTLEEMKAELQVIKVRASNT